MGKHSRNPSGRSSALRDGRAAKPATTASLAGEGASLAAAQPAPVAAAEGVQSPVAVQADLHSEVGAQAADLTASKPEAANRDEQGMGVAQVSCFIQTSDREIRSPCHQLC